MAIKEIGYSYGVSADDCIREFVIDSVDDVADLPECCSGSTAMVVDGSKTIYMVNASGKWAEF